MGFGLSNGSDGHRNEHEALAEILDAVIPEVARDLVFGEHEEFEDVDPKAVSDKAVLDAVEWDGTFKRRQKWLLIAGEMVFQAEQQRERQSLQSNGGEESGLNGLASYSSEPSNINWQDCYNEAADAVAIYVDDTSCAESIKDGLRRQTFGEEISIRAPREVLRRLVGRVRNRDDPTVDEVIAKHRKAAKEF